ncbi:MAG: glycosyltransferase family 2 protein [Verrucomicrobiota bacterium]
MILEKISARIARWPQLYLFHHRRIRYRIKTGKIRPFDPVYYLQALHWMQLGKYQHYAPRKVTFDKLPSGKSSCASLPSISIVTPSYNQGAYLEQTIKSVCNQNYPRLSYAVVDGGSSDGSCDVINRYRAFLSYTVSEKDRGQSDAIAKGMRHVSGEIQAYLNSDDLLAPGVLRFVGSYFAEHPDVDVVYGHRIIVNHNAEEIGRWILPRHYPESIIHFDFVPQETMFWRKSIAERIGGINPDLHYVMDWDFLLRLQNAGGTIRRLPYFMGCFRAHEVQKSQSGSEVGKQEILDVMKMFGGDWHFGAEFMRAEQELKRRALWTSIQMVFGIRS